MRYDRVRQCVILSIIALLLIGSGCGPIHGQVLDAKTKQPIAGAVVLGVWTRGAGLPGLSHTERVGMREAETDADGRFVLEWAGGFLSEETVTVYKFGYVAWNSNWVFPSYDAREEKQVPDQVLLEPFPSDGSHEKHMAFVDTSSLSFWGGPKFREAIRQESKMR